MKIKQRTLRVFEIECDTLEAIDEFVQKNVEIFKEYCVLLKGTYAHEFLPLLTQHGIFCIISEGVPSLMAHQKKGVEVIAASQEPVEIKAREEIKEEDVSGEKKLFKTLYDRPIRSGEEIIIEGDGMMMGRINGGSRVIVSGSGAFLDQIDGVVICDGPFALVRSIGKGSLIFCGEVIDKEVLNHFSSQGKLVKVSIVEGQLMMKDVG